MASLVVDYEVRTFEQRFGSRCFCGASWGDPTPCGDSRADWTIQRSLRALFAERTAECSVCAEAIPNGRKYCYDCAANVVKYKNAEDRHIKVAFKCDRCGGTGYKRKAKEQRYCSLSCSNLARAGK